MRSAWEFGRGIAKRFWLYVPALLLDPLDLLERVGVEVEIPVGFFYLALGTGVLVAAALTYHELRVQYLLLAGDDEGARRHAFAREIRDLLEDAAWLLERPEELEDRGPSLYKSYGSGLPWTGKAVDLLIRGLGREEGQKFAEIVWVDDTRLGVRELQGGIDYLEKVLVSLPDLELRPNFKPSVLPVPSFRKRSWRAF